MTVCSNRPNEACGFFKSCARVCPGGACACGREVQSEIDEEEGE